MGGDSRDILEFQTEAADAARLTSGNPTAGNLISRSVSAEEACEDRSCADRIVQENCAEKLFANQKSCSKSVSFHSGPFQIIDIDCRGGVDSPISPPRRRYSCEHYDTCLDLAAALNWDNYTCRGCSGNVDQKLLWRARQEIRKDKFVRAICNDMPDIGVHTAEQEDPDESVEAVG